MTDAIDQVQLFAMRNLMAEHDLDNVENEYAIDLRRGLADATEPDADYYPQIEQAIRAEAASMAPHYEVFYSLERTVRSFVSDALTSADENWWDDTNRVPPGIKSETEKRMKRETDSGYTPRSSDPLDFTTFGELGEIIGFNWDIFGGILSSQKAMGKVMNSLNLLRGPVAHFSPLAEDEVLRLRLTVRDWFRLMD